MTQLINKYEKDIEDCNKRIDQLDSWTEELAHKNAEMLDALKDLDTRIMPEERKYDEWGYCRIHKGILYEFDAIVKQAIVKAEGT